MKRAVVTGGCGFIGCHLAARLIREGYAVTVIDNLSTGVESNLDPAAELIKGDVSKKEDIEKLPADGVAAVFHAAAQSSGEVSFEDPYADFAVNAGGTLLMLDWCRRHGVKRFVFTSTMGVYGPGGERALSETDPCRPQSFYGIAKLAAENYTALYGQMGLETTVARLFNVYGPMQNLDNMKQGMASIYMAYLFRNEPIVVKGSMDRFRDQTYVKDVVDAMTVVLNKKESIGKVYNIATGRKTTVRELVDAMIKVSGREPGGYPVKTAPGTPGDIFGSYADVDRAKKELGWKSVYSVDKGLKEMYDYYRAKTS